MSRSHDLKAFLRILHRIPVSFDGHSDSKEPRKVLERMGDGRQDTWAEWKAAVLALSDDAMHRYLEESEGYTPDKVSLFLAHDAVIRPEDWATTDDAREAVLRFFAFKRDVLDRGQPGSALDAQEARAAALAPSEDPHP